VTKPREPHPESDGSESDANTNAGGTADEPEIKRVDLTPSDPVSFEVPPNTNLVVNVTGKQGGGCVSSFLSGCGCLATGFIVVAVVLALIGYSSR
jgi:hypothetical protein